MENGFYKLIENELEFGQTVSFPDGNIILIEFKDTYTYPVEGWYYFDTELAAREFFNLPIEQAND